jgi:uncharacterized protein YcbX
MPARSPRNGLLGDRAYALVDSLDGKVATAPNIVVETANGEKEFAENAWIGQANSRDRRCCSR